VTFPGGGSRTATLVKGVDPGAQAGRPITVRVGGS
jgi:hypothetical protein